MRILILNHNIAWKGGGTFLERSISDGIWPVAAMT